jgi:CO dehydrogenase maturation factor
VRERGPRHWPTVACCSCTRHPKCHARSWPGEYVVVCTAGADSFASGLFTRSDLTVLVAEPTRKGISVYQQWQGYAAGYDVAVAIAGNKVQTEEDVAFLRSQAGPDLARPRTRDPGHGAGTPLHHGRPEQRHVSRARRAAGHA